MSETTTKVPFDPIPVGGSANTSAALADPPKPSFSRSTPEPVNGATGGLLPPSRKPLSSSTSVPLPVGIAPETPPTPAPEPNPAAGTPPPNPAAVRGFFLDLFRPSRAKGAVAAGLVSLFAGAYGLNLVMPTQTPDTKKGTDAAKETAKGPQPSVQLEKETPQVIPERSEGREIVQVQNTAPAPAPVPLTPLGGAGGGGVAPIPSASAAPLPLPVPSTTTPAPEPLPIPSTPSNGGGATRGLADARQAEQIPAPLHPLQDRQRMAPIEPPKPLPLPEPEKHVGLPQPKTELGGLPPATKPDAIPLHGMEAGHTQNNGGWGAAGGKPEAVVASGTRPDAGMAPLPALPADAKPVNSTKLPDLPATTLPIPGAVEQPKANPLDDKRAVAPLPVPAAVEQPKSILPGEKKAEVPLPVPGGFGGSADPVKLHAPLPTVPDTPGGKPLSLPGMNDHRTTEAGMKAESHTPVPPLPAPGAASAPAILPVGGSRASTAAPPASVSESPPKTDFDVDVIRVRASDTYASLSEQVYGTRQYAAALKAFNRGADLSQLREVHAPPMHVIRKQQPQTRDRDDLPRDSRDDRGVMPAAGVRGPVLDAPVQSDTTENVDWGAPGRRRSTVKYEKFTTPREGMTAREVAKAVYDDEREWAKLTGPRGARLRADDPLPRGTELTVPREELPWK